MSNAGAKEMASRASQAGLGLVCEVLAGLIRALVGAGHLEVIRRLLKLLLGGRMVPHSSLGPSQQQARLSENLGPGIVHLNADSFKYRDRCLHLACQKHPVTAVEP